jgi:hypothetical protein
MGSVVHSDGSRNFSHYSDISHILQFEDLVKPFWLLMKPLRLCEGKVQLSLEKMMKGRAAIITAMRASIRLTPLIFTKFVFENGKVKASGTHDSI